MLKTLYDNAVIIDTSAVIAVLDSGNSFHNDAKEFLNSGGVPPLFALDLTSHECFTRARYNKTLEVSFEHYNFLRSSDVKLIRFEDSDEIKAEGLLRKYSDHKISFHDALCAAAMMRKGIYKIFTFDNDFYVLGFELLPGSV